VRRGWNAEAHRALVGRDAVSGRLTRKRAFSVLHVAVVGSAGNVVLALKRDRSGNGHLRRGRRTGRGRRHRRGCDRRRWLRIGGGRCWVLVRIRLLRLLGVRRLRRRVALRRIPGRRGRGRGGRLRIVLFFCARDKNDASRRQRGGYQERSHCSVSLEQASFVDRSHHRQCNALLLDTARIFRRSRPAVAMSVNLPHASGCACHRTYRDGGGRVHSPGSPGARRQPVDCSS
jgi:hypothetical protein